MSSTPSRAIIINLCLPRCKHRCRLQRRLINQQEQSPRWLSAVKYVWDSSSFCFLSGWSVKCAAAEVASIVPVLGEAVPGEADSEAFALAEAEIVRVRECVGAAGVVVQDARINR